MSAPDASHTADGHASGEALSHRQILIIFSGIVLGMLLVTHDGRIEARERTGRSFPVSLTEGPAAEPS